MPRILARTMGDFVETITRETDWSYLHRRSAGRICPLCEIPISNEARSCRRCRPEWREMLKDARDLAEWVVYVARYNPQLGSTVVWERAEGVKESANDS